MDLSRIDPAKLRLLVAVADAGSFGRGAQTVGISQPAISKSIKALEHAVGHRLFERGRAGARPTKQCELLVSHARVILAEYGLAAAELRALSKADTQQVAIGASLSLAQSVLPQAISRFRQRWPDATISVDVGFSAPLLDGLLTGDLDMVLSAPEDGVKIDGRLAQTFLLEERDALVVGAAHPLLRQDSVTIAQLLEYPWIVPRRSARLDRIHAVFASHRLPPPAHVLRSESADLARGLLQAEPFICLMGEGVLRADVASGNVAMLPPLGFESRRAAFLFMRRSSLPLTAARNLAIVLQEVAKAFN